MQIRSIVRMSRPATVFAIALMLAGCGGGLEGSTFEAKEPGGDGTFSLVFVDGEECKLAMSAEMGKLEFTTKYAVEGDKVTIQPAMPGDDPLILTHSGSTLKGDMDGEPVTFEKK